MRKETEFYGGTDKGFECQHCGKRFAEQRGLSQHLRVHLKNKCLTCNVCGEMLSSSFLLAEHKRKHAGARPYKCGFVGCDRFFISPAEARRHGRIHSKERPFVCPHCDKAFKAPNNLSEHIRLHTGQSVVCLVFEKNISCSLSKSCWYVDVTFR
jgi:KRAB domain-containing zinc finger protein